MLISCFKEKCNQTFSSLKLYKLHLRQFHGFKENGLFTCTFNKCFSSFTRMSSYFRHLHNIHENLEGKDNFF